MIYTVILHNDNSSDYTNNLVSNLQNRPYEIIDSSYLKTSFTESFNVGIIKGYSSGYDHIMICNNDISLTKNDLDKLDRIIDTQVGIFSPSCNSPHKKVMDKIGSEPLRNVYWLEFIAPIFHKNIFKNVGFLDLDMSYGWGVEIDYCYRAEMKKYRSYLVQDVRIKHFEHKSQSDHDAYRHEANMEMNHVLRAKYGEDWQNLLRFPQW